MRFKFAALLAGALFFTASAFASPVGGVFCAGHANGSTFTSLNAGGITATAWSTGGASETLVCKAGGVGEMGVGISGDEDNEIDSDDFVQLDISGLNLAQVTIESVQSNEGFQIFGSNSNGVLGGTSLAMNSDGSVTQSVTLNTQGFKFLDITATTGNVLVDSVTTPEPSSYFLMGTGLLMLGFMMRRKFASASL